MSATDDNLARILKHAQYRLTKEWGGAENLLGSRLLRALLAEEVLNLAAQQDEDVSAEKVRRIVIDGWAWAQDLGRGRPNHTDVAPISGTMSSPGET